MDYRVFPRLVAFAEVVWSARPPPGERGFAGFERRIAGAQAARPDVSGADYRSLAGRRPRIGIPASPGGPLGVLLRCSGDSPRRWHLAVGGAG